MGAPCCKLPVKLTVCPCCGGGIKQSRGWTWVDPAQLLKGDCKGRDLGDSRWSPTCVAANPAMLGERAGLLWIGTQFYPTPAHFAAEAAKLGVSRRINSIPRGFEVGKDWVLLAHPKAILEPATPDFPEGKWVPGIFQIFKPTAIEKIVTETMAKDTEEMDKLAKRGITPVIVPDNDRDHQGSVYNDDAESEAPLFDARNADRIDGMDRDDLGESVDY